MLPLLVLLACAPDATVTDAVAPPRATADSGTVPTAATSTTTSTTTTSTPGLTVSVSRDERIPTVVHVTWEGAATGQVHADGVDTPSDDDGHISVLGLAHGTEVALEGTFDGERVDLGVVTLPPQDADLPEWTVTVPDPARSEVVGQHLLVSLQGNGANHAAILDDEGRHVWAHAADAHPFKITRARWSHDRRSVVFSQYDRSRATDIGTITRVSLDGRERVDTRAPEQHHDFVEHADQTYAWLTFEVEDREIPGHGVLPVVGDGVRTGPEGALEDDASTPMFRFHDDWHDPWWTCIHFEYGDWIPDAHDWNHTNSIAWEPGEDAWYVMARHVDTLLKLDRQTGAVLWELGGPHSDFILPDGGFHHAHFSHVLGPDHVLVFDNDLHEGSEARVVEYRLNPTDGTAEVLWEQHDPDGETTGFLGDAVRLPGGNTLVVWSPNGRIEEFTPEGERVWLARAPEGYTVGRVTLIDDLYASER